MGLKSLFHIKVDKISVSVFSCEQVRARQALRKQAERALLSLGMPHLTDKLLQPGDLSHEFISFSHVGRFCGFAIHTKAQPVGFDLELSERVTPRVARRVSAAAELLSAPDAAALWCAKESAFKLLSRSGVRVLSEIFIGNWSQQSGGGFGFRFHLEKESQRNLAGLGQTLTSERLKMGISWLSP